MKIILVAPQPFFAIRGTPLAVRELATALINCGCEVHIATFHLGEDINLPGLTIFRARMFRWFIKNLPPGFSLKKIILDISLFSKVFWLLVKNKYDAIHCVEESAYMFFPLKYFSRGKFIFDMDSDIPEQIRESGKIKTNFLLAFIRFIDRLAIRASDAVIAICPVFVEKIKK